MKISLRTEYTAIWLLLFILALVFFEFQVECPAYCAAVDVAVGVLTFVYHPIIALLENGAAPDFLSIPLYALYPFVILLFIQLGVDVTNKKKPGQKVETPTQEAPTEEMQRPPEEEITPPGKSL